MNPLHRQILQGKCLDRIKDIPNESIDTIISSPPYFRLRDYNVEEQWGSEATIQEYLDKMMLLMTELKRVLKPTGTCWINLGDSYNSGTQIKDIEDKSRLAVPERFYIRCIDDGWIARNHIVWYKSNPMPSSVKDRLTNHWESIFFFAKEPKYYFNLDAIRKESISQSKPFNLRVREAKKGRGEAKMGNNLRAWFMADWEEKEYNDNGERIIKEKYASEPSSNVARLHRDRKGNPNKKQDSVVGADGEIKKNYEGFNDRYNENKPIKGKNGGDVWDINPKPFPEAHFATFPEELPLEILKCACPKEVCSKCGKPTQMISEPTEEYQEILNLTREDRKSRGGNVTGFSSYRGDDKFRFNSSFVQKTLKTCECEVKFEPGIVLDPFFGAGTVAVAAEKLARNWIGIELNQEYIDIANKRLDPITLERLEEFF